MKPGKLKYMKVKTKPLVKTRPMVKAKTKVKAKL